MAVDVGRRRWNFAQGLADEKNCGYEDDGSKEDVSRMNGRQKHLTTADVNTSPGGTKTEPSKGLATRRAPMLSYLTTRTWDDLQSTEYYLRSSSELQGANKKRRIPHGLDPNKILTPPSSNTCDTTGEHPAKRKSPNRPCYATKSQRRSSRERSQLR